MKLSADIIEKMHLQLSKFKQQINIEIDKLIFEHFSNSDNEILLIGENLKDYIEKQLLKIENNDAIYEYCFNEFNKPTEFLMIHESMLLGELIRYQDAYIRIVVKNKNIWIENWIQNDDLDDENEYQYNLSCNITEQQRKKLYGKKNMINTYNKLTKKYSYKIAT
jgi:hypothetical protein